MTSKTSWSSKSSTPPNSGGPINWLMCGLCVLSVTASGYFSYRETQLESRLGMLEAQFAAMRAGNADVVLERIRREVEGRFQQRMVREVASGRRLLMDVATSTSSQLPASLLPLQNHVRTPRDVSECLCPAGRNFIACYVILNIGLCIVRNPL
ncbi:hypothetical protein C0J52_22979 [Blattella germanica]|nr:hypothetical protein C0J52_22979 [Blattella germanica]